MLNTNKPHHQQIPSYISLVFECLNLGCDIKPLTDKKGHNIPVPYILVKERQSNYKFSFHQLCLLMFSFSWM